MQREYGITAQEFADRLAAQGGVCAICKNPDAKVRSDRLCVDHSHRTGEVRGLLCIPCNSLLGQANDSVTVLEQAIQYLMATEEGESDGRF
jgi:hypothetical protein